MQWMDAILRAVLVVSAMLARAESFIYEIDDIVHQESHRGYSEGWMYGTNRGPIGASQGPSYVDVDLEVTFM